MIAGALSFAPFLERYLGRPAKSFSVSVPATYIVHRDSQQSAEDFCAYLKTVHALINEAADGRTGAYFGIDLGTSLKTLSAAETRQSLIRPLHSRLSQLPKLQLIRWRLRRRSGIASQLTRLLRYAVITLSSARTKYAEQLPC